MSSSDEWEDLFTDTPKKAAKEEAKVETVSVAPKEVPQVSTTKTVSTPVGELDIFGEQSPDPVPSPEPIRKEETKQVVIPTQAKSEFDNAEAEPLPIEVITIFGDKGVGKTKTAFGLPGTIMCLSFDKQSAPIKRNFYGNDSRIRVWDAIRYLDESSPIAVGESSDKTFRYVLYILDQIKTSGGADWIVLDGSEVLNQICEQVMRARNSIMPTAGITNRNLWKERNMYVRQIHRKAVDCARKGVVYTTYVENTNIFKDGEIQTTEKRPKWIDIALRETSVVIYADSEFEKGQIKFYNTIVSSKSPFFKTGVRYDVTNKNLFELLESKK